MKKLWKHSLYLILPLCSILLTACTGKGEPFAGPASTSASESADMAEPRAPAQEKILYSNGGPIEFFETPWLNPGNYLFNKVLYAHMIVCDENLSPLKDHPDALATYDYSEDGKTLTFELREAYWHDGELITPEDIKWSIEYVSKTALINPVFKTTFSAIQGSDGGKSEEFDGIAIDGNKLVITFDKPAPDALLTFTQFAPVPKKYFEGIDPLQVQQAPFFQNPVGSGPFCVEEVQMNNYTVLKPFDQYYNGVADFKIQLSPSGGDSDENFQTKVKSGQIDYGSTKNIADVKAIEGTPGITITPVNVRYTRLFYLNKFDYPDGSKAALADVRVRQALRYAIDMKSISEGLFDNAIIPADVLIPGEADKATGLNSYEYNPDKARELLAEAGWDPDTTLKVVFHYSDQMTVDFMTAIQAAFKEVGVKMEFNRVEGDLPTILWKAPEDQVNGPRAVEWDMVYAACGVMSLHEYYDRYMTGSPTNSHTPMDEKLNELLSATNTADPVKQAEAFKKLSQYENDTVFTMALYYQPMFLVTSEKAAALKKGTPQFNYDWSIQNLDIQQPAE